MVWVGSFESLQSVLRRPRFVDAPLKIHTWVPTKPDLISPLVDWLMIGNADSHWKAIRWSNRKDIQPVIQIATEFSGSDHLFQIAIGKRYPYKRSKTLEPYTIMLSRCILLGLFLAGSNLFAKSAGQIELGHLQTGATVNFTRSSAGEWGLEVIGGTFPAISQPQPARLDVFRAEDDIRQLAAGYTTVQESATGIDARAEVRYDSVVFHVQDHWSISGSVLSVRRKVDIVGNSTGGFGSAITFTAPPAIGWSDVSYMAPGALYGDPTYNGDRSVGGTLNYAAHHFFMREDLLPAPLFGLSFPNGTSVTVSDPSPRGDSTVDETKLTQAGHDRCSLPVRRFGSVAEGQRTN